MKTRSKGSYVTEILKALIFAVIISLVLVVLAAFLVKWFNIADNYIKIINQVIKGLSIFIAAAICLKLPYNGWLRGVILGVLFILIAVVVFSLLGDGFDFDIKASSFRIDSLLLSTNNNVKKFYASNKNA